MIKNLQYPLNFKFHVSTLHNDFSLTDAQGQTVGYARQKMFKLKEHVNVFTDKSKSEILFTIKASKWLDFNTAYEFRDVNDEKMGKVTRKGWRSLWKASYQIIDNHDKHIINIKEKSATTRILDSLLGEIPILSFFSGYLFNPTYLVERLDGTLVCELKKDPSFFGRKFTLHKSSGFKESEEEQIVPSIMMMLLLERHRG